MTIQKSPMNSIISMLSGENMRRQFETACPTHLKANAERYIRQFCTQLRLNPRLVECEQGSLIGAMMTGTALGLDPSPSLGEFYIVPYRNKSKGFEAQFQLGYKGMVALAYRGGVRRFQAHIIYEKDEYDYGLGLNPYINHKPYLKGDRGKAIAYYAVVQLPSGDVVFDIMSQADVDAHARRYSKSVDDGPWRTEFDEMAKKTVAKNLFKWIPKSTEVGLAISKDGGVTKINGEVRSLDDVIDAEVRYLEPDDEKPTEALANEILTQARPAAQEEKKPEAQKEQSPTAVTEIEKLRRQLDNALGEAGLGLNDQERAEFLQRVAGESDVTKIRKESLKIALDVAEGDIQKREIGSLREDGFDGSVGLDELDEAAKSFS